MYNIFCKINNDSIINKKSNFLKRKNYIIGNITFVFFVLLKFNRLESRSIVLFLVVAAAVRTLFYIAFARVCASRWDARK